jgi:hypothetical protein
LIWLEVGSILVGKDLITLFVSQFSNSSSPFDSAPTRRLDVARLKYLPEILEEEIKDELL